VKYCYYFFEGYNSVIAASQILINYGIDNRVVKAPVSMTGHCSYAVLIHYNDVDKSLAVLRKTKRYPAMKKCI
jgi:hypothetical protein